MINKVNYLSYAYAIFEIAKENNEVSKINDDSHQLLDLLTRNEEIIEYLLIDTEMLDYKQKEKLLDAILDGCAQDFINAIKIIVMNHYTRYITQILRTVIKQLNKIENILEGFIYTTSMLSTEKVLKIEQKLSKEQNKKIKLTNLIDQDIIAGYRIAFEDQIIENSVASQMRDLKKQLLGGN